MIKNWVIQMAISFVMRQVAKWQMNIDWAKVKADVAQRVADLVPGTWFDSEATAMVMAVVDAAAAALAATSDLEKIVKLAVDGDLEGAWKALRALILGSWAPKTEAEQKVFACIEGCESIAA